MIYIGPGSNSLPKLYNLMGMYLIRIGGCHTRCISTFDMTRIGDFIGFKTVNLAESLFYLLLKEVCSSSGVCLSRYYDY